MDPQSFTEQASGELVRVVENGIPSFAFIPDLLPGKSTILTADVAMALSDADSELGRLDGLASNLPDPEILIGPFLRREAILSSRIEGTQTTFSELVLSEANAEEPSADTREVTNYIDALKYGVRRVTEIPLGKQLLNEIHAKLLDGADPDKRPGQFRDRQVFIGPAGLSMLDARYVPPPAYAVPPAFDNLVTYLTATDKVPLLIRLAVGHYQFEAIHPFIDGNGRLGRLLVVLLLCQSRRISAPMLYLSAYFERRRARYNDLMLAVSQAGNWEAWILFFLNGIALQAKDAVLRTQQLHELRGRYRERVTAARRSTSALALVDALFRFPVMTTRIARGILKISDTASLENIQKLVDADILVEVGTRAGRRLVFVAHEIVQIIDRAEAIGTASTEPVSKERDVRSDAFTQS